MLYLILSILAYILQNVANKEFSRTYSQIKNATLIQNGLCLCFAAIVLLFSNGFQMLPFNILLLALVFGIAFLLTIFF